MINKGYFSYKNKYNKKYGYEKEQSHNLKQISKDTGVSMKGLQQIYNKGIGAYKTNPSSVRPSVKSKEQWAMARVYSSVMGGKASKIDANELKMAKGGGFGNFKIVAFKEDLDYKYYVVDEIENNYLIVAEDKFDKWKNADKLDRAFFYSELIPKSEMVEIDKMENGGGVGNVWITNALTTDKRILSEIFDYQITHQQLYDHYKKQGYEIVKSQIHKITNRDVLQNYKDALANYIKQKFSKNINWDFTLIPYSVVQDKMIIPSHSVRTTDGNEIEINPNDLFNSFENGGGVSSKINLLHTNTKTYEDLSKIKGQVVNDVPKSKSVPEIDIQIVDSLNFEGKGKKINNSKDAYIIFNDLWDKDKMLVHEEMNVLFVNKANNVIGYYKHSKGGIDGTVADVEMICSLAVKSLAKGVLVAHNHPSGNLTPSNADIQVSKELKDALKLFKISLLDSIIITKDNYKSLADESLFDIGGRVEGVENFSLARFEDFDEEDERENEENEKGAILLEAIEYGRKTLDQNLLPKLLANTELSNIIFIYLSKYKEFNLYKLGWRIQFGLSKQWVGLCSVKEYEKIGVGKESKNRNIYLSSQYHKYDKNWKINIKETVHHEMAHAVVRELFYFSDDTFGVWSRFLEIDPLNEQTEGHGKIWEMICNTILEGGGCSRYAKGLDLEVQFKDWKYECFNCGTKKFGNRSNFATKCVTCGKSVLIQKNKY